MKPSSCSSRRAGAELPFDGPSSAAYESLSDSAFFRAERLLFMRELRRYQLSGELLDIGCGPGHLLGAISKHYPALALSGLDISEDMIELAGRNLPPVVKLVCADAASMPLEDGSMSFIVSSGSLHHWDDAAAVFKEIRRVLAPGGRLLIMDLRRDIPLFIRAFVNVAGRFAPEELKRTRGVEGSFESAYTPGEMRTLLATLPFHEIRVSTGFAWMFASGRK